jgi:hypothetical protein
MEYLARQDGRIGDSIFLQIHPSPNFDTLVSVDA